METSAVLLLADYVICDWVDPVLSEYLENFWIVYKQL